MRVAVIVIFGIMGALGILIIMGAGKLYREEEEREWREIMEKREKDG